MNISYYAWVSEVCYFCSFQGHELFLSSNKLSRPALMPNWPPI